MLRSTAVVASASAHRDIENLLGLLARAPSVRVEAARPSTTCLVFLHGVAAVLPVPNGLRLIAAAVDDTSLGHIEAILARAVETVRGETAAVDWHFASADDRAVRLTAA